MRTAYYCNYPYLHILWELLPKFPLLAILTPRSPFSFWGTLFHPVKLPAVTHVPHSLAVRNMTSNRCYFACHHHKKFTCILLIHFPGHGAHISYREYTVAHVWSTPTCCSMSMKTFWSFYFQIDADLKPKVAEKLLKQPIDFEKPGLGQFYCVHCA